MNSDRKKDDIKSRTLKFLLFSKTIRQSGKEKFRYNKKEFQETTVELNDIILFILYRLIS